MWSKSIKPKDIHLFLSQFATLIAAGVPIITSLETLETAQHQQNLRILIYSIKRDLQAGNSLYMSLKNYPTYFNDLSCHLIDLGEHTGKLATIISAIVIYQDRLNTITRKFKHSLMYPSLILITSFIVTLGLLLFVVPQFAGLFANTQVQLPLITKVIFALSANLNWLLISSIPIVSITLLIFKRHFYDLPLIKSLYRKFCLTNFCRSLQLGLTAGLVLHVALGFAAKAGGKDFSPLETELHTGVQFHEALETIPTAPALLIQLVKVGEASGKLSFMLGQAADFFEAELYTSLQRISTLFEPLIILLLGVLIGGLVISMYLPIFNLGSTI